MFGLDGGVFEDAAFAFLHELIDAELFDGTFGTEAELLFDFDFDPEALAVESILVTEIAAIHGPVALEGVFVGAAPGVVDAHGIVGRDGAVEKTPRLFAGVFGPEFLEDVAFVPELEDGVLTRDEFGVVDFGEHRWWRLWKFEVGS